MMELNFNLLCLPCSFGLLYIIVYNLYVLPCCCRFSHGDLVTQSSYHQTRRRSVTSYKNCLYGCFSTVPGICYRDEVRPSLHFKNCVVIPGVFDTERFKSKFIEKSYKYIKTFLCMI